MYHHMLGSTKKYRFKIQTNITNSIKVPTPIKTLQQNHRLNKLYHHQHTHTYTQTYTYLQHNILNTLTFLYISLSKVSKVSKVSGHTKSARKRKKGKNTLLVFKQ